MFEVHINNLIPGVLRQLSRLHKLVDRVPIRRRRRCAAEPRNTPIKPLGPQLSVSLISIIVAEFRSAAGTDVPIRRWCDQVTKVADRANVCHWLHPFKKYFRLGRVR